MALSWMHHNWLLVKFFMRFKAFWNFCDQAVKTCLNILAGFQTNFRLRTFHVDTIRTPMYPNPSKLQQILDAQPEVELKLRESLERYTRKNNLGGTEVIESGFLFYFKLWCTLLVRRHIKMPIQILHIFIAQVAFELAYFVTISRIEGDWVSYCPCSYIVLHLFVC